jgi:Trypsin-like peptidase domain
VFTAAAGIVGGCLCAIKDPTDHHQKEILGQGCMLTDQIVLTARKVVHTAMELGAITVSCPSGIWTATELWSEPQADLALLRLDRKTSGTDRSPAPSTFPRISETGLLLGTQVGYMGLLTAWDHSEAGMFLPTTFFSGCVSRRDRAGNYPEHYLTPNYSVMSFSGGPAFFPDGSLCGVLLGAAHIIATHPTPDGCRHLNEFDFLFPRISSLAPHQASIERHTHP